MRSAVEEDVAELREVLAQPLSRSRLLPKGPGEGGPSSLHLVPRHQIAENPLGLRGDLLPNVPGLADTILRHGLLQNLLGVFIPEHLRRRPDEWIELKAGSRRLAAIDFLIAQGHLDPNIDLIPILLIDGDGFWQHIVENVARQDCKPWEIGRYLLQASDAGAHHRQIGIEINKSQGWVSRHIMIGKGLAPDTIAWLNERGLVPKLFELQRIAIITDRFGDPDPKAQIEALERSRRRRKTTVRRDPTSVAAWHNRVEHLKGAMPVPPLLRPVVSAVLDYLELGQKPNFKSLMEQFAERGRVLFGPEEDE